VQVPKRPVEQLVVEEVKVGRTLGSREAGTEVGEEANPKALALRIFVVAGPVEPEGVRSRRRHPCLRWQTPALDLEREPVLEPWSLAGEQSPLRQYHPKIPNQRNLKQELFPNPHPQLQ
jgi:hypothetical protein